MKKLAMAFAAMMIGLAFVAVQTWTQLRNEREQIEGLKSQLSRLEEAHPPVPALVASEPAGVAALPAGPDVPASPDPVPLVARAARVLSPPTDRAMMEEMMRYQFPSLAKDLELTAAEMDKLLEVLASQISETRNRNPAGTEEVLQVARESYLERERKLSELLGKKYAQWVAYEGVVEARKQVREWQSRFWADGNALTELQVDQLVAAMAPELTAASKASRERSWSTPASRPMTENRVLIDANERNRRVNNVAVAYLTSAQMNVVRQIQDKRIEADTLAWNARQSLIDAQKTSGASP